MLGGTATLAAIWLVLGWSTLFNSQLARLESLDAPTLQAIHEGIVEVDWSDVAGADRYEIQLRRPSGWVNLPDEQAGVAATFDGSLAIISNLPSDSTVDALRVRAGNCRGWSQWSDPAEQVSTYLLEWEVVPVPRIDLEPKVNAEPTTIWSASIVIEEHKRRSGLVGYSIQDGLGAAAQQQFRESDRQFGVLSVLNSRHGLVLESFSRQTFSGDFSLSIEDAESSEVTHLSTCDAIRRQTTIGERFVWPNADLNWSDGQKVDLTIARDSEPPPMRAVHPPRASQALTAEFEDVPSEHGGDAFSLLLRFSDPLKAGPATLGMSALRVTGGHPISAQRVDGRSDLWNLRVMPDGRSSIRVRLVGGSDCNRDAAICTQHEVPLSNRPEVTVPGPAVTAEFSGAPEHHSGLDRVDFEISFSEPISISTRTLGEKVLSVRGGRVDQVRRVGGRSDLWQATVIPESSDDLVVTLNTTPNCAGRDSACLELHRLSGPSRLTIPPATIHLTFDDGPSPKNTPVVLDILKRHNARATFFVVGRSAVAFPEVIDRIVSEGHTLANHTWAHDDLLRLSEQGVIATLQRTQHALGEHATPCFRPPNYRFNQETVRQAASIGLTMILNTGETADWRRPGADAITANIIASAKPNVILVLHDGPGDRSQMLQALDASLTYLRAQRYAFEPVCE